MFPETFLFSPPSINLISFLRLNLTVFEGFLPSKLVFNIPEDDVEAEEGAVTLGEVVFLIGLSSKLFNKLHSPLSQQR